jgi:hypothetical protein
MRSAVHHDVHMTSDADCIEANVDYGVLSGHFIRVDVEIPSAALNGHREDGGPTGCLILTDDEAERLGRQLLARVTLLRELREGASMRKTPDD